MPREEMRNLHVPLPAGLYQRLRQAAERSRRPATDLAREAIDRWLAERRRAELHAEITAYAAAAGGTRDDLDPLLERAGTELLRGMSEEQPKRGRGRRT